MCIFVTYKYLSEITFQLAIIYKVSSGDEHSGTIVFSQVTSVVQISYINIWWNAQVYAAIISSIVRIASTFACK